MGVREKYHHTRNWLTVDLQEDIIITRKNMQRRGRK